MPRERGWLDNYQRKCRMHQHKCRWVARYVEKLLKFSSGYFNVLIHLLKLTLGAQLKLKAPSLALSLLSL